MVVGKGARVNALVVTDGDRRRKAALADDRRLARDSRERRAREACINVALTIDVRHKSRSGGNEATLRADP